MLWSLFVMLLRTPSCRYSKTKGVYHCSVGLPSLLKISWQEHIDGRVIGCHKVGISSCSVELRVKALFAHTPKVKDQLYLLMLLMKLKSIMYILSDLHLFPMAHPFVTGVYSLLPMD